MELKQVIEKRMSIRSFTNEEVNESDLKEMVRRAGLAPTLNNSQPWKFIAITNKSKLKEMAELVISKLSDLPLRLDEIGQKRQLTKVEWYSTFFENAPSLIALIMKPHETDLDKSVNLSHDDIIQLRNYPDLQSAGASIQNILLSAVDLGYGACWLSGPMIAKEELQTYLNIESPWHLIAFVAIGKPFGYPNRPSKKSIDEIFTIIR
ncbi:MAG: nitroreductase family protein [Bacteroidetes bacterium]|nr:nitroreductase family protein [Bacteroidota bacterium]